MVYIRIPRWMEDWHWQIYGMKPNNTPAMPEERFNENPWRNSTHSLYGVRIRGEHDEAEFEEEEVVMLVLPIKPVRRMNLKRAGEIADIVERVGGQNLGRRRLCIRSCPVSHFWTLRSQLISDLVGED